MGVEHEVRQLLLRESSTRPTFNGWAQRGGCWERYVILDAEVVPPFRSERGYVATGIYGRVERVPARPRTPAPGSTLAGALRVVVDQGYWALLYVEVLSDPLRWGRAENTRPIEVILRDFVMATIERANEVMAELEARMRLGWRP